MKIFVILLVSFTIAFIDNSEGIAGIRMQSSTIHPTFKSLLIKYPRDKEIVNPQVPRIDAKLALNLYRSAAAIFIAAGEAAVKASLPGAIPLEQIKDPKKLKQIKHKLIILFCH